MATLRERRPGVWQVRVFTGRNAGGVPTQVAVTVHGTKRDALREAARLESNPRRGAAGRTVGDALRAWLEHKEGSYRPASLRDQTSRVRHVETDPIAGLALRVAAVAGARRAELAALRWRDLHGSVLTVDSAVTVVRTEDGPVLIDSRTKTAERHTVSLDRDTVELRERLRAEYEDFGPYVCNIGDTLPNPDRVGWWWHRAREASGIDKRWRLHDVRHFSATMAIGSGFDVRTVAHRLGHADPSMTLRVYAHAVQAAVGAVGGQSPSGSGSGSAMAVARRVSRLLGSAERVVLLLLMVAAPLGCSG